MQSTRCSGSETPVAEPQKAADGQRVLRLSGLAAFSGSGALLTSFVTRRPLCRSLTTLFDAGGHGPNTFSRVRPAGFVEVPGFRKSRADLAQS